jgi:hypothetical protein
MFGSGKAGVYASRFAREFPTPAFDASSTVPTRQKDLSRSETSTLAFSLATLGAEAVADFGEDFDQ